MHCKCGYSFAQEMIKSPAKKKRAFESYAAISDRDYRRFLKLEMAVLACEDKEERLAAIARSSRLAGCVLECPQCSRLLFVKPRTNELVSFIREE